MLRAGMRNSPGMARMRNGGSRRIYGGTEATLGDYKYVAIKNGDTTSAFSTGQYVPLRLRQAMDTVLIRIPSEAGKSRRWKLKHKKLNGVDFKVLATEDECGDQFAKAKCVTEDYLSPDGMLRIHVEKGSENVYNNFHAFRGLSIPMNIMTSGDGVLDFDPLHQFHRITECERDGVVDEPIAADKYAVGRTCGRHD